MVLVVRLLVCPKSTLFIPSVADSVGDGVSCTSSSILPSKLSVDIWKGELESPDGDMTKSAIELVVKTALEGEDASAKGGRRIIVDGLVDDIDDLTESVRRFAVFPFTLIFDVEANGEPLAI